MRYLPNTFYMTVHERFTASSGEPSLYSRMFGNGHQTYELQSNIYINTKSRLREEVEKVLSRHTSLEGFICTETSCGWCYERYVRWLDDDGINCEIVEPGEHTDHEVYVVDISYYEEVSNVLSRLNN